MLKKILILIKLNAEQKKRMEEQAPSAVFMYESVHKVSREQLLSANIIIGNPPPAMVKDSNNLEWLQLESAGANQYVLPGVLPDGVTLTNATGAYGLAISEHMLGMVLEIYKKLYLYRDNQRNADWSDEGVVKSIFGSTALIVGLGDIGGEFASRIKALGGYTIGIRRQNTNKPAYLDELYKIDKLDELLPRADIVALSLPATQLTDRLMNHDRIKLMKRDAVLLNVGRGNAVDTEALCDALESGHLLGAGLDVTDPEPLPKEHRLWKISNAVITPHISGGNHLPQTYERIFNIAVKNLNAFLNGKALDNIVDYSTGYRKL